MAEKKGNSVIKLRNYPKAIHFDFLFVLTGVMYILQRFILPADYINGISVVWLIGLFFNLIVIAYDVQFSKLFGVIVLIAVGCLVAIILWEVNIREEFWKLGGINLALPNELYLAIFTVLGIILTGIILGTRLEYIKIERNEIYHKKGVIGKKRERYPTRALEVDMERPDCLEYFFGTGRVILKMPSLNKFIQLDTVFRAKKKFKAIDALLSDLQVED